MIKAKSRIPLARNTVALLRPLPPGAALKAGSVRVRALADGIEDALKQFDDKSVLVTGGTGSFGRRFIDTLLTRSRARRLVVVSRDEYKQYEMQSRLAPGTAERMRFFIGDVRDVERLRRAVHGVDVVVHAAALKQVPACEYNPMEAIKTNILGAQNVV